ncbi:hypothetical protein M407DRAFT_21670 [Tulasnella calospora MUT 4182]|uniref:Uncharacterized protein n=1 Tax=Tulasnella calospora MUT 4182 TaxID=1051891 RepID=A0A0C3QPJ8_9AGAM|nr:hypothetical protein M407DRAFT_21670 [Tulasnella calospora MUT 4182]
MAPNRPSVANVSSRFNSINPPSSASVVPDQTSALRSQPAVQRTKDTFDQVQQPVPPAGSPDPPYSTRPTLGLTNNTRADPVSYVRRRDVESAIQGVQGMRTSACGLLGVWPLEKLVRLFGGRRNEGAPQPEPKQVEKNAEAALDALQAVDMMDDMVPPPYPPPK